MDIYKILEGHGLTELLHPAEYQMPEYTNWALVREYLSDIVENNRKTQIIGDYDVDGLMCNLIMKNSLRALGCTNVFVHEYKQRTHTLEPTAIYECIQNRCDYCIICDCGSHDISLLRKLLAYGVKVILLDHHETLTTYDEFAAMGEIAVINTVLEENKLELSAGALCYTVMREMLKLYDVDEHGLAAFAIISLYADCMDMHDYLNRSIYYLAHEIALEDIPAEVSMFMNKYHRLNARFINFWFSPRINAMFRSEQLEVLNRLFLRDSVSTAEIADDLEYLNQAYENIRDLILKVSDIIEVDDLNTFVIGNLNTVNEYYNVSDNLLWNYTGLIANKLSDRYSKPAVVFCNYDSQIKGSLRDIFGRDFLTLFQQICRADGHLPAFGFKVRALDFDEFMHMLKRLDKQLAISDAANKPIVIPYKFVSPDAGVIEDIAWVNEFAGPGVPMVLLQKQRIGDIKERKTDYGFRYDWEGYVIESQHAIGFGQQMLLKPFKSWRTKLLVQ